MRQPDPNERRCKIIRISPAEILDMFAKRRVEINKDGAIMTYSRHFPGLPEDVVVCGVYFCHLAQKWDICIRHPSFPEVPHGEMLPVDEGEFHVLPIVGACYVLHSESIVEPSKAKTWRDEKSLL
jgi:hypothetical protein